MNWGKYARLLTWFAIIVFLSLCAVTLQGTVKRPE
jgi:hypothetical protein